MFVAMTGITAPFNVNPKMYPNLKKNTHTHMSKNPSL